MTFQVGDRVVNIDTEWVQEWGENDGLPVELGVVTKVYGRDAYEVEWEFVMGDLLCYGSEIELQQLPAVKEEDVL